MSVRSLNAQSAEPIRGTEGAVAFFWSPDSQQLGFTTRSAVKKVTISDRAIETLCEDASPGGRYVEPKWADRVSVPRRDAAGIPAAGGEPQAITSIDRSKGEIAHIGPHFLPDGQRFLYVIRNAEPRRSGLYIGQVGSPRTAIIASGRAPGHLCRARASGIYSSRQHRGPAFRREASEIQRRVVPLVAPSEYWPAPVHAGSAYFRAGSEPGQASRPPRRDVHLRHRRSPGIAVSMDGSRGVLLQVVGRAGPVQTFDLAPDGTRLVFSRGDGARASLWMFDLTRGVTSRLTFGASASVL